MLESGKGLLYNLRAMNKFKKALLVFWSFFKIGLFTFGGGYAMIALLEEEFIQRRRWLDKDEFLDMTAIAESTPGPVAINSATYLGYKLAGVPGAATATVAVCLPSFLIIYAISLFFEQFTQLTVIANAFKGIQVCVIYLIFSAGVRMLKALDKSPFATGVLAAVMLVMVGLSLAGVSVSSILLILLSGAAGVAAWLIGRRKEGK